MKNPLEKSGTTGEVVVRVEFLTGAAGYSDPKDVVQKLVELLEQSLQNGPPFLRSWEITLKDARYEEWKGKEQFTLTLDRKVQFDDDRQKDSP